MGKVRRSEGLLLMVMTEHALQGDQVGVQLQMVGRKTMPEGMHPAALENARDFLGLLIRPHDGCGGDGLVAGGAGEKPPPGIGPVLHTVKIHHRLESIPLFHPWSGKAIRWTPLLSSIRCPAKRSVGLHSSLPSVVRRSDPLDSTPLFHPWSGKAIRGPILFGNRPQHPLRFRMKSV